MSSQKNFVFRCFFLFGLFTFLSPIHASDRFWVDQQILPDCSTELQARLDKAKMQISILEKMVEYNRKHGFDVIDVGSEIGKKHFIDLLQDLDQRFPDMKHDIRQWIGEQIEDLRERQTASPNVLLGLIEVEKPAQFEQERTPIELFTALFTALESDALDTTDFTHDEHKSFHDMAIDLSKAAFDKKYDLEAYVIEANKRLEKLKAIELDYNAISLLFGEE